MRLDNYTKEMMDENSFIDMSFIYLEDKGKDADLYEIIDKFKEAGNYEEEEIENRILQFYTDLNTDGRFLSTGENIWGLRDWYSVDDISDKVAPTIHKIELATEEEEPEIYEGDDSVEDAFDQDKELVDRSEEIENRILQFYTDLNTDGRFLSTGENIWGLRDWYSVDDISDKVAPTIHKIELATEEEEPEIYEGDDSVEDAFDQDKELVD